jgi:hypothetical protein
MELSAVNSRENVSDLPPQNLQKGECWLRFRNSQDLRIRRTCGHSCQANHVFSVNYKWLPHCTTKLRR